MQEKIQKFEGILERELDKEMDRIISAGTLSPADVKTMTDAVRLMLKVKEYEDWCDEGNSYDNYPDNYSMRRGRNADTGRYVSREGNYSTRRSYRGSYDQGYSGHSITDRMVSRLEDMYDEAKTDHERQLIDEWIGRIENSR